MRLLDLPENPSGREQVTQRPAWRVQLDDGRVLWAFIEQHNGQLFVTGYPMYAVDTVQPATQPGAGFLVGAGAGALLGAALGGPGGAVLGGIVGALLGASGSRQ